MTDLHNFCCVDRLFITQIFNKSKTRSFILPSPKFKKVDSGFDE